MTNSSESYLFKLFELTCERYVQFCNEKNYEVSDFIRKVFNKEKIRLINKISDENFIYLKLCGNNKVLTKMRLTDEHIKGLCGILEEDESIKSLDLRFNRITDKGAEYIANLIKRNHSILEYNLMGNDIEEAGAKFLADAIVKSSTIKTLKMTGNKIGDFGGMQFAQAIQINESLEELDLGECDLKISSVISFATVLLCNTTLKSLNLDRPLLWTQQEETTVHMENMLYINKSLVELHLAKYEMRDFGMERLCDALIINRTLTVLDLSCNRITRDGAKILAKVLKCNTPLKVLDLGYNRIHDQGIKAIANSLCYCNTNLKCLVITFNEIHDEGLMEITAALELNTTLDKIYIWGNEFTSDAIKYFGALMDRFRLMESKVDVRPYSVDGIHQFALLPHNVDFRRYRYTAPIYGDDIPENRSYAIS